MKTTPPMGPTGDRPAIAPRKRIMIVDDHPMTRLGLASLINAQPDLAVCCEAGDPAAAQQLLLSSAADLVVADLVMPGRSGNELIKDLRALDAKIKILVLSMQDEGFYGPRVLRAGARGYVMKNAGGDCVLAAIRQVLNGEIAVSPALSMQLLGHLTEPVRHEQMSPVSGLTDREFEIFRLIGQGFDTQQISEQLHLSPKTVGVHRANIQQKFGFTKSTALYHYAIRWIENETDPAAHNRQ